MRLEILILVMGIWSCSKKTGINEGNQNNSPKFLRSDSAKPIDFDYGAQFKLENYLAIEPKDTLNHYFKE